MTKPSEAPSTIPADVLGFAVVSFGKIDVNTVSPTRRGALVNWLVASARIPVYQWTSDEDIEASWRQLCGRDHKCGAVSIAAISRIDVPDWKQDQAETSRLPRKPPAPAEEQGAAVKVKPLEWRDHRPDSFPEPAWSAQTPFGFYNIEEVCASDSPAYVVRLHAHHFIADKDDLADAQAAAQADYETRIRSALDIEAQGVAVSVEELAAFLGGSIFGGPDDQVGPATRSARDKYRTTARALLDKYSIRSAMMTEGE